MRLQVLDRTTGEVRWRYELAGAVLLAGATAAGDTVLLGSPPTALDLATGQVRWTIDATGTGVPAADPSAGLAFFALASAESTQSEITAISLSGGSEIWRAPLPNHLPHPFDRLILAGGLLIVPTAGESLLGLDPASGAIRWQYTPPGHRFGAVTAAGDRLWILLQDGRLLLLDAATGNLQAISPALELNLSSASYLQRPLVVSAPASGSHIIIPTGIGILGFHQTR
jgi:outer membrane protein assembly factor BamB